MFLIFFFEKKHTQLKLFNFLLFQLFYCLLTGIALIGPGMMMGYSGIALPLLANETTSEGITLTPTTSTWFGMHFKIQSGFSPKNEIFKRVARLFSTFSTKINWAILQFVELWHFEKLSLKKTLNPGKR